MALATTALTTAPPRRPHAAVIGRAAALGAPDRLARLSAGLPLRGARAAPMDAVKRASRQRRTGPLTSASSEANPRPDVSQVEKAASDAADALVDGAGKAVKAGNPRGAAVYGGLAGLYGVLAVAKVAAPAPAIELVYNASGVGSALAFMRLAGVFTLLPAVALWCLKDAAEHGRLNSNTYERLNLSLMIGGLGYAGLAAAAALSSNFMLAPSNFIWGIVAVGLVTAAAAVHVLARGGALGAVLRRIPTEAAQVFQPANALAAFYSVLTVATFLMGAALLAAPSALHGFLFSETVALGPLNIALKRNIGMLIISVAVATAFTLKDGADRNRLGASTFKLLNLGFAAVCAGTLATLGFYVHSYPAAQLTAVSGSMFAVLAAAAGTCGYQWATAKK